MTDTIFRDAKISDDGLYRYVLIRVWDKALPVIVFIMLNPSTADALVDDATIRACMAIARAQGCGGIVVVNLFAFRATQPMDMKAARDPIGPENDMHIARVLKWKKVKMVIAAWGADGRYMNRYYDVMSLVTLRHRIPLYCLGTTQHGAPKHPLARGKGRIPHDFQPIVWREAA